MEIKRLISWLNKHAILITVTAIVLLVLTYLSEFLALVSWIDNNTTLITLIAIILLLYVIYAKGFIWIGNLPKSIIPRLKNYFNLITATATIGLVFVAMQQVDINKRQADIQAQQINLTNLISKPKANLDFICPKLENGTGTTNVTFSNDGEIQGLFTIRVNSSNMLLSLYPYFENVTGIACVKGSNRDITNVFIGPKQSLTYPLVISGVENNACFSIEMKCQSELCIGYSADKKECDITKSDQVLEFTCKYPEANDYPYPSRRTYNPEKCAFCGRCC